MVAWARRTPPRSLPLSASAPNSLSTHRRRRQSIGFGSRKRGRLAECRQKDIAHRKPGKKILSSGSPPVVVLLHTGRAEICEEEGRKDHCSGLQPEFSPGSCRRPGDCDRCRPRSALRIDAHESRHRPELRPQYDQHRRDGASWSCLWQLMVNVTPRNHKLRERGVTILEGRRCNPQRSRKSCKGRRRKSPP